MMTIDAYNTKRQELLNKAQEFIDAGNIGDEYKAVLADIDKLDNDFADAAREQANLDALKDNHKITNLANVSGNDNGLLHLENLGGIQEPEDIYASVEYRLAFMNHFVNGKPIPAKFRNSDESTTTGDVQTVIPTTIVPKIVERMEAIGMILPLVSQTMYATGISIPTSSVIPEATWVAEGASSDRQKKTTGYISFSKFKLRCEISMSMEVSVMALPIFEATFTRQVSKAMLKKIEGTIMSEADGSASAKGILSETPVEGQAITAATLDYAKLIEIESALPEEYEGNAVYAMSKKTFLSFIGMTDAEGNPIARTNAGINGKPERTLLGRPVITCGQYLPSFTASTVGQVFAIIFNFEDYAFNTVYDMGIQRKQDWDTEDLLTKAVMSADGKVIDKNSLVTIAKAAAE